MPWFLGVDGGGTKTRFALLDDRGALAAQAQFGTTYHPEVGLDGARRVLADGVAAVLAQVSLQTDDLRYAFFGLPAYGEDSALTPGLDRLPHDVLGHARYACDNDMVCGWAGSLACGDGINLVAGTGSIGYGQRQGRAARAGGWGQLFSDEGSAYWIAMQGLNAYSRMSDGRLDKGPLHAILNEALALERDLDLCARVYGAGAWSRGELAQLSQLVSQAANDGDPASVAIFRHAGEELAEIADAVRVQLGFEDEETVPLTWSGGAFSAGDLLLVPLADAAHARHAAFDLRAPLHDPHHGAALYAIRLAGDAVS